MSSHFFFDCLGYEVARQSFVTELDLCYSQFVRAVEQFCVLPLMISDSDKLKLILQGFRQCIVTAVPSAVIDIVET